MEHGWYTFARSNIVTQHNIKALEWHSLSEWGRGGVRSGGLTKSCLSHYWFTNGLSCASLSNWNQMKKGRKRRKKLKRDQEEKSLDLFVFLMDRECETLVWAAPANLSQDFLPLFLPGQSSETLYGESDWNSGSDFFTMEESGAIRFLLWLKFHQTTFMQVEKLSLTVEYDYYGNEWNAQNPNHFLLI